MAAILKFWRRIKNLTLSVDVFLGYVNLPAKFHPDPFWNDGALSFLKRLPQQEEEQDE